MFSIFKRRYKHKWEEETWLNEEHHMCWFLRRCKCGAIEMLSAGGTGDKKWHPFTGGFRFDWEKDWFNAAEKTL
jgi:hypothetical protein